MQTFVMTDCSQKKARDEMQQRVEGGGDRVRVWLVEQDDGRWTVAWLRREADEGWDGAPTLDEVLAQAGGRPAAAGGDAMDDALEALREAMLGDLSARYESNGKPGAIGFDTTGGYSYGMYQIATRTGTMARFLEFLGTDQPALAKRLAQAGGDAAARNGAAAFQKAWRDLATTPATQEAFRQAQHGFIEQSLYAPLLRRLQRDFAFDANRRSAACRDVLWSVAVQHGPNNRVVSQALAGCQGASLSDTDFINRLYDTRSQVQLWFKNSTAKVQASVRARFDDERRRALAMLASDPGIPANLG